MFTHISCMTQVEFEHIAIELRPSMWKVGMDFFGSSDDAEDVAQEALVQLWQYAEKLDAGRNISGLAIRIAKHCCVDMQRRRRGITVELMPAHEREIGADASPHEELERTEAAELLQQLIDGLNPRERELFELRQLDGLSNDEIAQRTGIAKASIQVMVSRARKKVYEEMRERLKK
ncbi:MAG: sigma-70 family RNA polymerase sigma factor [Bacteroidaceae bacterium]|nr:sigma-70 family RNA polymerase sigma factor [Bacteroidaceae bacterium]